MKSTRGSSLLAGLGAGAPDAFAEPDPAGSPAGGGGSNQKLAVGRADGVAAGPAADAVADGTGAEDGAGAAGALARL